MNIEQIFSHTLRALDASPRTAATEPRPRVGIAQEGSSPRADARTASVSASYPVKCEPRFYDAASQLLENEPPLFTHDNCNELGALIEAWIHRARNNWEPE